MPSIEVPAVGAPLTADATAAGVVTVGSTTDWYPGQAAWMSSATATAKRVRVLKILSGTTLSARVMPDDDTKFSTNAYGGPSDLSAFKLADTARIDAARQVVQVDQPTFSKLPSYLS